MSDKPRVGIALAAYKPNIEYLVAQLESIRLQTYENWFCCLSFDSPLEDIQQDASLASFLADSRFDFSQNYGPQGATENFECAANRCLQHSPDFLAFSDQDDIWNPDKLEKQVAELRTKPPMSLVHSNMRILKKTKVGFQLLEDTAWEIERRGIHHVGPLDFLIRNIAAGAGMVLDAELMRHYGKIPADAYGHDHWVSQVASFFGGVHAMPEALYQYRIHGDNIAGMSEYRGFFSASRSVQKLGTIRKCVVSFNVSRARFGHVKAAGLPTTLAAKITTVTRCDLGFGYILKAAVSFRSDRALARACLARAAGKIFGIFLPNIRQYSAM